MAATSGGTCWQRAARAAGSENRSSPKGPAVTFSYCFTEANSEGCHWRFFLASTQLYRNITKHLRKRTRRTASFLSR